MTREELLDLIPAYALGALDADDRAAVEAWLPTDPEAQRLLAKYMELAGLLALTAPAVPTPVHLSADLLERLAASRPTARPATRRSWLPMLVGMAAALVLLAAGLLLLSRPGDPGAALYARLAAQAGRREVALTPGLELATTGTLVASPDGREAVIRVENLPALGADQTFQLWLVDEAGARSGGLFQFANPSAANYLVLPLEKPVEQYVAFGVSLEPAGGSPFPDRASGPRVFRVEVKT